MLDPGYPLSRSAKLGLQYSLSYASVGLPWSRVGSFRGARLSLRFYRGLETPVRPVSGIPNPQPVERRVPRIRSPSHPWEGHALCQTPVDQKMPVGRIQPEGIKQVNKLWRAEGKKQAKILRLGGAQNDRCQTGGRREKAQSISESLIVAIFRRGFKELRIA